jgi:BolA protein
VYIVSDLFSGKSKLQRHRIINELLHDDIKMIHALSLSTKTSDEAGVIEETK